MDAERMLISRILADRDLGPIAEAGITSKFFLDPKDRRVFDSIIEFNEIHGSVPTIAALRIDFPEYKFIKVADPTSFLISEIQRKHALSLLQGALSGAVEAYEARDPNTAVGVLLDAISQISADIPTGRDVDLTETGIDRMQRYRELRDNPDVLLGAPTGFHTLDRATQGLQKEHLVVIAGPPKAGKAQPLNTPILTPNGWLKMGELEVGDYVVGSDGKPTQVIAVHERGTREVFLVTLDDGTSTRACADHLWTVNPHSLSSRTVDTLTLRENISKNKRYGMLPVVAPVQFSGSKPPPIHPYVLGLLLGDGGLTGAMPRFTTVDPELVEVLRLLMPPDMSAKHDGKFGYRLGKVGGNLAGGRKKSSLTRALISLDLMGCGSYEKFIPTEYLYGSEQDRRDLLAGLLDTDGGMEGNSVSYCTVSPRLADGVRELVLSLGGCVRVKEKYPSYRNDEGTIVLGKRAYLLKMRLPYGNPFRLSRKIDQFNTHATNFRPPTRRVVSVDPAGLETVRCITVENSNGLYVTESYIVTHNSAIMLLVAMAAWVAGNTVLMFTFEMSNDEMSERFDAFKAGISNTRLRTGRLKKDEWDKLEKMMRQIESMPPFWFSADSSGSSTLSGIAAKVNKIKPDILFVDGIYLMTDEITGENNTSQSLTNLTRGFKRLAQNKEIPVVISSQVLGWKMDKKKGVTLNSIGYSSSFGQDANTIIAVEGTDDTQINKIKVVASRNCPPMEVFIQWNWEIGVFEELQGDPFEDVGQGDFDGTKTQF